MIYIILGLLALVWLFFRIYHPNPLLEAAEKGYTLKVRELLCQGARIHTKDTKGNTALIYAAWRGHIETVQVLLEKGALVNMHNYNGETPLTFAARNGHAAIVSLLLNQGAVIKKLPGKSETAFTEAIWSRDLETLKAFIHQGISFKNPQYQQVFCDAIERANILKDYHIIRLLLENAPDLQTLDCFNEQILIQLYETWNFELLKLFLEKGANPNILDECFEESLLWRAYTDQRMDIFSLLIQHGADYKPSKYLDKS